MINRAQAKTLQKRYALLKSDHERNDQMEFDKFESQSTTPLPVNYSYPKGKIFALIPKIMSELGAIGKTNQVSFGGQSWKFRGIDDLYNALNPLLAANGVFTVPKVIHRSVIERVSQNKSVLHVVLDMEYSFYADDGSFFTAKVVGEAIDSGDKASNKAMSIAHKYALLQTFAIPTQDEPGHEKDPDFQVHELEGRAYVAQSASPGSVPGARNQAPRPVQGRVNAPGVRPQAKVSEAQIKRLFAISRAKGWTSPDLTAYARSAFGVSSLNELNRPEYDAFCDTVGRVTYFEAMRAKGEELPIAEEPNIFDEAQRNFDDQPDVP